MASGKSTSRAIDHSTKLRDLKPWALNQIIKILDTSNCWEDLAALIQKPGTEGEYLFSASDVSILEREWRRPGRSPARALLEHWSTVGKDPPIINDLLEVLKLAENYQAANFISVKVLQGPPVCSPPVPDECADLHNYFQKLKSTRLKELGINSSSQTSEISSNIYEPQNTNSDICTTSMNSSNNNLNNERQMTEIEGMLDIGENSMLTHFKYEDLSDMTRKFQHLHVRAGGRLLGEGAFGSVYLAVTASGQQLAVKCLKDKIDKQYFTEIKVLTRYQHPNLLNLLGYSCDGPAACLVYFYMANGSLQERLACADNTPPLSFQNRIEIAIGTARGICHLHSFIPEEPLVHRDIKSANILLDKNMIPKVGDFGLVRVGNSGTKGTVAVTQAVFGTSVYMAREAFRGDVSVKLDTFSYGIVLFEILTGLPPYDESREERDLLSHMEENCISILEMLDISAGQWISDIAVKLFEIAKLCTQDKKRDRPTMIQILPEVEALLEKI